MTDEYYTLEQVRTLAKNALITAGASEGVAASVAHSTYLAERDGIRSHGLLYVPIYAEHIRCGKVNGTATPSITQKKPTILHADAKHGFAHPAIDAAFDAWMAITGEQGLGVLAINHSYNCGVLGHHAERVAEQGFVGLCFTHAPASIAPPNGFKPIIGTNPFALAVPNKNSEAVILIDQSASAIAKSEIILRAKRGEAIEAGWALDKNGKPTTDATAALAGSMLAAGGYKGFGVGLLVEILASCLAGAVLSQDASPFSGTKGGPPATGQFFMAFDPAAFNPDFFTQIDRLTTSLTAQDGVRLAGARKKANRQKTLSQGVKIDADLLERLES